MEFKVVERGRDILELSLEKPENICLMCGINSQQHCPKDPPPVSNK